MPLGLHRKAGPRALPMGPYVPGAQCRTSLEMLLLPPALRTTVFLLLSLCGKRKHLDSFLSHLVLPLRLQLLQSRSTNRRMQTLVCFVKMFSVLSDLIKLFHLQGLPVDRKTPEILSEFLPASKVLLCSSKKEIMVLEKLLAAPEEVLGTRRVVTRQSSDVLFPHVLPPGSQGGIPGAWRREWMPPCGSRLPKVELMRAWGLAHRSGWRMAWPSTCMASRRNYGLRWADGEVPHRHPLPSPATPATHSMEIRFILQLDSPGIYRGSQYLSGNCNPEPKAHYSQ